MHVVVMGTGGLGGFYGGRLALAGHKASFVARGPQLDALKKQGLRLVGPDEDALVPDVVASSDPADLEPADYILFCVKLYDVEEAASLIRPIVGSETSIVSVLNGINGPERISHALQHPHVFGGAALVSAKVESPGVVRYMGRASGHSLIAGHLDSSQNNRLAPLSDMAKTASFDLILTDKIEKALWDKVVQLATVAGLTSLGRFPIGTVLAHDELKQMAQVLLSEVYALAKAKKIPLDDDIVQKKMDLYQTFPPNLYASMYHDLAAGKRMEVEDIIGYLVREAASYDVPMPCMNFIYAFLKPWANGQENLSI